MTDNEGADITALKHSLHRQELRVRELEEREGRLRRFWSRLRKE
jgi:hypothetical protein